MRQSLAAGEDKSSLADLRHFLGEAESPRLPTVGEKCYAYVLGRTAGKQHILSYANVFLEGKKDTSHKQTRQRQARKTVKL